jgi:hypothetical protein
MKQAASKHHAGFLLGLFFNHRDEGSVPLKCQLNFG